MHYRNTVRLLLFTPFVLFFAGGGENTRAAPTADTANSAPSLVTVLPAISVSVQGFGFGPVKLRVIGTTPKTGAGVTYSGDCDNAHPEEDDIEVMTFSAPWKVVGQGAGGSGAGYGSPASRSFTFEKSPEFGEKRLKLEIGRELTRATVESLTAGLDKVADIAFGAESVGLYFVRETGELAYGYVALFPVAEITGLPPEQQFTNRYIARVSFTPVGPLNFDGWNQAEIVQLYESLYTARCLGETMGSIYTPMGGTVVYE